MDERDKETEKNATAKAEPSAGAVPDAPPPEKPAERPAAVDPDWWIPWAVLVGLVLFGLLGFLGVLTPARKGPSAADVPATTPAPSASDKRPIPAR
jgi:hypothetical protein